jgi:mono/diheme cytochrome c family protein
LLLLLGVLALVPAAVDAAQPTKRPTDEDRGRELYERHCNACHGPDARGKGPATEALVAEVPNLKGKVRADKPTIAIVQDGKGSMPAYEPTFDVEDTKRVLQWMAMLPYEAPAPASPAPPKQEEEPPAGDAPGPPGADE